MLMPSTLVILIVALVSSLLTALFVVVAAVLWWRRNGHAQLDQQLDEIGDELKVSHRLQKIGRSRTLLNFVIHKAERSQAVRDTIMGMMANEVPKKQLTNPLFYLKLLFS